MNTHDLYESMIASNQDDNIELGCTHDRTGVPVIEIGVLQTTEDAFKLKVVVVGETVVLTGDDGLEERFPVKGSVEEMDETIMQYVDYLRE